MTCGTDWYWYYDVTVPRLTALLYVTLDFNLGVINKVVLRGAGRQLTPLSFVFHIRQTCT